MNLKDKLSNILKVSEDEYYDVPDSEGYEEAEEPEEDDYEPVPRYSQRNLRDAKSDHNKVVSINASAKLQVVLTKPKSMEEARGVADNLNQKKPLF